MTDTKLIGTPWLGATSARRVFGKSSSSFTGECSQQRIAKLAYALWEERGFPGDQLRPTASKQNSACSVI
jgi:hypothetical protein